MYWNLCPYISHVMHYYSIIITLLLIKPRIINVYYSYIGISQLCNNKKTRYLGELLPRSRLNNQPRISFLTSRQASTQGYPPCHLRTFGPAQPGLIALLQQFVKLRLEIPFVVRPHQPVKSTAF